jgi:hypothetical protein
MSNSVTTIQSVKQQQSNYKPGTLKHLDLQRILDKIYAERFLIYVTQGSSQAGLD